MDTTPSASSRRRLHRSYTYRGNVAAADGEGITLFLARVVDGAGKGGKSAAHALLVAGAGTLSRSHRGHAASGWEGGAGHGQAQDGEDVGDLHSVWGLYKGVPNQP